MKGPLQAVKCETRVVSVENNMQNKLTLKSHVEVSVFSPSLGCRDVVIADYGVFCLLIAIVLSLSISSPSSLCSAVHLYMCVLLQFEGQIISG